ncbi:MAG: hypothetical protein Terrestrivirus4_197 [Terrestrivirus sp.]|uniref:RING-type domain-containing protein n=1 Tax=Terrestrivirus sp. TaxID=2487775 RepID=A0A3G4ZRV5_9VIRU|nr:MAG: hypothetical protein Terrestrivirus4_197 [Terrestrivirus sp.]
MSYNEHDYDDYDDYSDHGNDSNDESDKLDNNDPANIEHYYGNKKSEYEYVIDENVYGCDICFEEEIQTIKTECGCSAKYCKGCINKMENKCCVCKNYLLKVHVPNNNGFGNFNAHGGHGGIGGGLMQLIAYGAMDVYLTGNPNISFWKISKNN